MVDSKKERGYQEYRWRPDKGMGQGHGSLQKVLRVHCKIHQALWGEMDKVPEVILRDLWLHLQPTHQAPCKIQEGRDRAGVR